MGKMAKIAKAGKWLGKKAGDLGTSISMKTKKQFGTKDRQVKATEGDPSFKRGFFNRKTFFQGKTQKAAQQLEKQVFHGVNSLKLQETAHKANAYTAKLKAKEESINALRKQSGTIGKAKGLLSWGFRTKAQKDLSVAIRNQKYLKEKKKQYEVESTKLLNKLKGQSTAKTNTVLAQKTSLSNALTHLKKSHNTKMEAAKTAKQAEVDKLKRLVSVKTTVNSDFTKATKDYYDAKQSGKVITNAAGKPIPIDILRTKMVTAKQAKNAFNTSSQSTEIKTLGKKLKTEKKIQYIKAENLGNVARGSKKGMEVKNKATRATFTASLNVRQARKDAIKGTLKKLQQYAAPETQEKLAKRITEADALLKNTTKKGIYTKQERQAIKDGLKARAIFGAFSRTGVEIQLQNPGDQVKIASIIAESQKKRNDFIGTQASQIALNKANSDYKNASNKLIKTQKFQLFRRSTTKDKQVSDLRTKVASAFNAEVKARIEVQKAKAANAFFRTPNQTLAPGAPLKLTDTEATIRETKLQAIRNSPQGKAAAAVVEEGKARAALATATPEGKIAAEAVLAEAVEKTKQADAAVLAAATPEKRQIRAGVQAAEAAKLAGGTPEQQQEASKLAVEAEKQKQTEQQQQKLAQAGTQKRIEQAAKYTQVAAAAKTPQGKAAAQAAAATQQAVEIKAAITKAGKDAAIAAAQAGKTLEEQKIDAAAAAKAKTTELQPAAVTAGPVTVYKN
jgi:hypothetical protein